MSNHLTNNQCFIDSNHFTTFYFIIEFIPYIKFNYVIIHDQKYFLLEKNLIIVVIRNLFGNSFEEKCAKRISLGKFSKILDRFRIFLYA